MEVHDAKVANVQHDTCLQCSIMDVEKIHIDA
jgi:hypothetical protein